MASTQPSATLYIQNVSETLKARDLKRCLYAAFSAHGKVLDVVVSKSKGMSGQAFIVFKDMAAATAARRREDGSPFLGKRMRIQYAKSKSHATIKEEEGSEALYLHKIGLHDAKTERLTVSGAEKALDATKSKRDHEDGEEDAEDEDARPAKRGRVEEKDGDDEGEISFVISYLNVWYDREPLSIAEAMEEDSDEG